MSPSRGGDRRVAALVDALQRYLPESGVLRVPAAARAGHLAARRAGVAASMPMVVVARTDEEAHRLADDLSGWIGGSHVLTLPERAALPLERALPEHDESGERLSVLAELGTSHRGLVVIGSLLSFVQRSVGPAQLRAARTSVSVGERVGQRALLERLVAGGYEPTVEVTGIGEFAHRGGLVDAWPPGATDPVRIELFGDEVDSIRTFDAMTQASRRRLERVDLVPASEFLAPDGWERAVEGAPLTSDQLREDAARLAQGDVGEAAETWAVFLTAGAAFDHVPDDAHLVVTDLDELRAMAGDLDRQALDRLAGLVDSGELPP